MCAVFDLPELPAGQRGNDAQLVPDFVPFRSGEFELVPGHAGDHHQVYRLLLAVFQEPTLGAFQHLLEEPGYDPQDRLLIRRGGEIVAHIQMCHRRLRFGPLVLRSAEFRHLVTLPEYRSRGLARRLLTAALHRARSEGAVMATTCARTADFFRNSGWVEWNRFCTSVGPPRGVLSHLPQPRPGGGLLSGERPSVYTVRMWRRNELDVLIRLHAAAHEGSFGALLRDDLHWQWVLARGGYDRIYVAEARPPAGPEAPGDGYEIAGYGIVRRGQVLEICAPAAPLAARAILARVCADAIEAGRHSVQLDAPPTSCWHGPFRLAGGHYRYAASDQGRYLMARIFDADQLLTQLKPLLLRRWREASIELPASLGLQVGPRKLQLALRGRRLEITTGHLGRSYLTLSEPMFAQLLLGQHAPRDEVRAGAILGSTRLAVDAAEVLFPQLPLWHPCWDDPC